MATIAPTIIQIHPENIPVATRFTLTVYGYDFTSACIINLNGGDQTTAYAVDSPSGSWSSRLTCVVNPISTPGPYLVYVINPGTGDGPASSNIKTLTISTALPETPHPYDYDPEFLIRYTTNAMLQARGTQSVYWQFDQQAYSWHEPDPDLANDYMLFWSDYSGICNVNGKNITIPLAYQLGNFVGAPGRANADILSGGCDFTGIHGADIVGGGRPASMITINGTIYHVDFVTNQYDVTLLEDAGHQTGVRWKSFEARVWDNLWFDAQLAGGTLQVPGDTFNMVFTGTWGMCDASSTTVTLLSVDPTLPPNFSSLVAGQHFWLNGIQYEIASITDNSHLELTTAVEQVEDIGTTSRPLTSVRWASPYPFTGGNFYGFKAIDVRPQITLNDYFLLTTRNANDAANTLAASNSTNDGPLALTHPHYDNSLTKNIQVLPWAQAHGGPKAYTVARFTDETTPLTFSFIGAFPPGIHPDFSDGNILVSDKPPVATKVQFDAKVKDALDRTAQGNYVQYVMDAPVPIQTSLKQSGIIYDPVPPGNYLATVSPPGNTDVDFDWSWKHDGVLYCLSQSTDHDKMARPVLTKSTNGGKTWTLINTSDTTSCNLYFDAARVGQVIYYAFWNSDVTFKQASPLRYRMKATIKKYDIATATYSTPTWTGNYYYSDIVAKRTRLCVQSSDLGGDVIVQFVNGILDGGDPLADSPGIYLVSGAGATESVIASGAYFVQSNVVQDLEDGFHVFYFDNATGYGYYRQVLPDLGLGDYVPLDPNFFNNLSGKYSLLGHGFVTRDQHTIKMPFGLRKPMGLTHDNAIPSLLIGDLLQDPAVFTVQLIECPMNNDRSNCQYYGGYGYHGTGRRFPYNLYSTARPQDWY